MFNLHAQKQKADSGLSNLTDERVLAGAAIIVGRWSHYYILHCFKSLVKIDHTWTSESAYSKWGSSLNEYAQILQQAWHPWVNLVWERHYSSSNLPVSSNRVGSFWWKDILKLLDSYKCLAMVNVSDGRTCLFWEDLWLNKVPHVHYPQLFSFARNTEMSLHLVISATDINDFLHLPLSDIAATQLLELAQSLSTLQSTDEKDHWSYIWGNPLFSTSKTYKHLIGHLQVHPFFWKLCKSSCQNKHKFFFGFFFEID